MNQKEWEILTQEYGFIEHPYYKTSLYLCFYTGVYDFYSEIIVHNNKRFEVKCIKETYEEVSKIIKELKERKVI